VSIYFGILGIVAIVLILSWVTCFDGQCWDDSYWGGLVASEDDVEVMICENRNIQFDRWNRTVINAYSSLSFVILGAAVMTISMYDSIWDIEYNFYAEYSNPLRKHVEWGAIYGFYMIFLGMGSFYYHSSFTQRAVEYYYFGFFNANFFALMYSFINAFFSMHKYRIWSFNICIFSAGLVNLASYYIYEFRNTLGSFDYYWIAILLYCLTLLLVFVKYMIEACRGNNYITQWWYIVLNVAFGIVSFFTYFDSDAFYCRPSHFF
jgi:hypothetical protein